jgi:hypothetical protein
MKNILLCFSAWLSLFLLYEVAMAGNNNGPVNFAINGYIRPNTERFAEIAELQKQELDALCQNPDEDQLAQVKDSFDATVKAWARLEFLTFGPLVKDNRAERILFWPDRRGTGLKQVQAALARQDKDVLAAGTLYRKSVALQGLGALEYLLFGTGSQVLAQKTGDYRCRFALSVATNIHNTAVAIYEGWDNQDGFAAVWQSAGPQNSRYRDEKEAQSELVKTLAYGFEMVRDTRLKPITTQNKRAVSHKRGLFWRSNNTFLVVRGNIEGLRDFSSISRLGQILPRESQWIGGSIASEFVNIIETIDRLELPVEKAVYDNQHADVLRYLIIVTRSLQNLFGERLAGAIGLETGFSALDGD